MKRFNCTYYLCSIELGPLLIESLVLAQICEELTTIQEVDQEVQLTFRLESVVQAYNIRILYLL